MGPSGVLKTIWHHKWVALAVIILTAAASFYIFTSQRTFTSTATYALIAPKVPTDREIELNPSLAKINSDNPYLRSPDGLLSQVLITRLSTRQAASSLQDAGLASDYTVTPGASGASVGLLLQIQATGKNPSQAIATVDALGKRMQSELKDVQKVNGADDSYLIKAELVQPGDTAQEVYTSRLRSIVVVAVAGLIALLAAISISRRVELMIQRRRHRKALARAAEEEKRERNEEPRPAQIPTGTARLSKRQSPARTGVVSESPEPDERVRVVGRR